MAAAGKKCQPILNRGYDATSQKCAGDAFVASWRIKFPGG
jgi:hypothetical protein